MNLVIMRHPQSEHNAAIRMLYECNDDSAFTPEFLAKPDHSFEITRKGFVQALQARHYLNSELGITFDHVYRSPYKRVEQLNDILDLADVPVTVDDRLIEQDWGHLTTLHPRNTKELRSTYDTSFFTDPHSVIPGGESVYDHYQRLIPFWQEIEEQHTAQNILILTHAGTMRLLKCLAENIPLGDFHQLSGTRSIYANCQCIVYSSINPSSGEDTGRLSFVKSVSPSRSIESEHPWQVITTL